MVEESKSLSLKNNTTGVHYNYKVYWGYECQPVSQELYIAKECQYVARSYINGMSMPMAELTDHNVQEIVNLNLKLKIKRV